MSALEIYILWDRHLIYINYSQLRFFYFLDSTMEDFIPTRAAKNKENADKFHMVTTYESHKKSTNSLKNVQKKKQNTSEECTNEYHSDEDLDIDKEPIDETRKQELQMKQYRYDVIKFGMSGFDKHKARQAKIALAISLGAKPPKNRRKNYKKLVEERIKEKARETKKEKFASGFNINQLTKNRKNITQSHTKKDKESNGILGIYGKVTKDKVHNKNNRKNQRNKR